MECVEAAVGPASGPADGVDWPVVAEEWRSADVAWLVVAGDSDSKAWARDDGVDSPVSRWDVRELSNGGVDWLRQPGRWVADRDSGAASAGRELPVADGHGAASADLAWPAASRPPTAGREAARFRPAERYVDFRPDPTSGGD
jgi:hypothetical protein